jgi:uncharacterized membrane protein
MRRLLHLLNLGLSFVLVAGSLWAFPRLPAQIPRHFGLDGTADAYWAATLVHWMLLPGIAIAVAGVIYGAAWWIGRAPGALNVPNQQQYDALDPADKRVVLRDLQAFLYGTASAMLVAFSVAQWGTYHVATSGSTALPTIRTVVSVGGAAALLAAAPGLAWWLSRRVRRLADDA